MKRHLPVTVLSAFIGAGKTMILNHVRANRRGFNTAMIVKDRERQSTKSMLDECLVADAELAGCPKAWAYYEERLPVIECDGADTIEETV